MSNSTLDKSLTSTSPVRAVAGSFALCGFTIAMIAGWGAGNSIDVIVIRALFSLFFCLLIGLFTGYFCLSAVGDYLKSYMSARPVPDSNVEVEDIALEIRTKREQQHPTAKKINN